MYFEVLFISYVEIKLRSFDFLVGNFKKIC